jgi:flagellar hook-associated protein FlgK
MNVIVNNNLNALHVANLDLQVTANNIANTLTPNFKSSQVEIVSSNPLLGKVVQTQKEIPLSQNVVNLNKNIQFYQANAKALSINNQLIGTILSIFV